VFSNGRKKSTDGRCSESILADTIIMKGIVRLLEPPLNLWFNRVESM